ncbi:MAG: CoA transferase [Chloroflexi bacterium]|nr:CoA transferase [Chloroflexota bacterium]
MSSEKETDGVLAPYRVLDLSDEKGHLCGKVLGDLGADVIKIEPLMGDAVRYRGPFYRDQVDSDNGLQWWAFNTSKRGVTLDIESREGQDTLRRLAAGADILIESFPPGHMEQLGLGYEALSEINPRLIVVSVTHFGQTGPYRDYKGSDLVDTAMGGIMYIAGDRDRPPVRMSVPQAYLAASLHAAAGAMIALWERRDSGRGQHVDVSVQATLPNYLIAEIPFWEYEHKLLQRAGPSRAISKHMISTIHPCKDGHVAILIIGGPLGKLLRPLAKWMKEEGMSRDLMDVPWEALDLVKYEQADIDAWESALKAFFMKHTRAELLRGAVERHIPLAPGYTIPDLIGYEQLAHRRFWVDVEHREIPARMTYPGEPLKLSHAPWRIRRRAPLLGEHNDEVLQELSGSGVAARNKTPVNSKNSTNPANSTDSADSRKSIERKSRLPLEGIVVADFTRVLIGPLLGKYLADFGATVVRVESRLALDQHRVTVPYKGEPNLNRSGIFPLLNSSKLSLGLNLSNPRGVEVAKRLISRCDVVLENFVPGMMERWGLGFEDLLKIKPGVVMFRHSTQGQSGPYSKHPGFGWNVNALVGVNHITGWPDREAVGPCVVYPDYNPAFLGVATILAALDHSRRTGQGQCIDVAQLEANLPMLSLAVLDYVANGRVAGRCGNKSPWAAPHNAYPCLGDDRWCAIAVESQRDWESLCGVMENPAWTKDPRFSTVGARKRNEEEMDCLMAAWTTGLEAEDVMTRLQAAGVSAGVVESGQDLLERDPQLKHRGHFLWLEQPDMGRALHQGWTVSLSRTPYDVRLAPTFGEHTEYVCTRMLGISDEEFVDLLGEGVVEAP